MESTNFTNRFVKHSRDWVICKKFRPDITIMVDWGKKKRRSFRKFWIISVGTERNDAKNSTSAYDILYRTIINPGSTSLTADVNDRSWKRTIGLEIKIWFMPPFGLSNRCTNVAVIGLKGLVRSRNVALLRRPLSRKSWLCWEIKQGSAPEIGVGN